MVYLVCLMEEHELNSVSWELCKYLEELSQTFPFPNSFNYFSQYPEDHLSPLKLPFIQQILNEYPSTVVGVLRGFGSLSATSDWTQNWKHLRWVQIKMELLHFSYLDFALSTILMKLLSALCAYTCVSRYVWFTVLDQDYEWKQIKKTDPSPQEKSVLKRCFGSQSPLVYIDVLQWWFRRTLVPLLILSF